MTRPAGWYIIFDQSVNMTAQTRGQIDPWFGARVGEYTFISPCGWERVSKG